MRVQSIFGTLPRFGDLQELNVKKRQLLASFPQNVVNVFGDFQSVPSVHICMCVLNIFAQYELVILSQRKREDLHLIQPRPWS
jgi:hypothetical protein